MKKTTLAIAAAAALLIPSCISPIGMAFSDVTIPVQATSAGGNRVGVAKSTTYLGLFAKGDSSIAAAKRNGHISTVSSVDVHVDNVLGIVTTFTTTVTGH